MMSLLQKKLHKIVLEEQVEVSSGHIKKQPAEIPSLESLNETDSVI